MFHTVAYSLSTGAVATTDTDMTLVSDPSVTNLNGHPIFPVPTFIQWVYLVGTAALRARLSAPRLRPITRPVIAPVDISATQTKTENLRFIEYWRRPIQLNPVEEIQFLYSKTGALADVAVLGLTVGDNQRNVPQGDMYTLRATSTNGVAALAWQPAALTADDTLMVGRYSIVGLRVLNATATLARLIFPGAPVVGGLPQIRPGVIAVTTVTDEGIYWQRYGMMGEYGQFESFALPQTEVLGNPPAAATDTFMDIVSVRIGARAQ